MNYFQKIIANKALATVLVIVVLGGGYIGYKKLTGASGATHYALAAVQKGTIVTSVTGTGQVTVSDQVDIKPKASGEVIYLAVKDGQAVRSGALIARLDDRNAQKAVRDAQISLANAQISLSKLGISQGSSLPKSQDAITTAQNNITSAYQDGFNDVSNAFLDMPNILTGIKGVLFDSTVGTSTQQNIDAYQELIDTYQSTDFKIQLNHAQDEYNATLLAYNKNFDDYRAAQRTSDTTTLDSLMTETLATTQLMSQTVKDEQNIIDTLIKSLNQYHSGRTIPSAITGYQTSISTYISKLNTDINALNNRENTLTSNRQALANAQRDLASAQQSNPLDLASAQNDVDQHKAALQDAENNLSDYYVRAPFDGIIAKTSVQKGDTISSGTAVATIITKQTIAEVSLNEIDAAKVKLGQKATLTFDAIPNLSLTGSVIDIDTLGTVTQGVVTYNAKIALDTPDDRIKPGMSVSAAIITDSKQDVLLVPNSAVKSSGGSSYVLVPDSSINSQTLTAGIGNSTGILLPVAPQQQAIETGLASDTMTEVTSGLKEGDLVITRTITASTTTTSTQSRSLFPTGNTRGGTGGGIRTGGGATGR